MTIIKLNIDNSQTCKVKRDLTLEKIENMRQEKNQPEFPQKPSVPEIPPEEPGKGNDVPILPSEIKPERDPIPHYPPTEVPPGIKQRQASESDFPAVYCRE